VSGAAVHDVHTGNDGFDMLPERLRQNRQQLLPYGASDLDRGMLPERKGAGRPQEQSVRSSAPRLLVLRQRACPRSAWPMLRAG
jgi:hypothetical protein